jgi:hypothetical protein
MQYYFFETALAKYYIRKIPLTSQSIGLSLQCVAGVRLITQGKYPVKTLSLEDLLKPTISPVLLNKVSKEIRFFELTTQDSKIILESN